MFRALYTAATGMQAQQTNLDTIANNLSNSSTAGFQSRRMQFQDLIYQNLVMPGAAASQQTTVATGLQVGLGTRSAASEILQMQGDLSQTGNPLDLAIEGQGLFQVLLPTGADGLHAQRRNFTRTRRAMWSPPMEIRCSRQSPYRRARLRSRSLRTGRCR